MVEINNQRMAFLDSAGVVEGIDNGRQKTRNHGYDAIVGGELFIRLPGSPSQTCHATTQNSNQQAPDATSFFSCWWMSPQAAWPERLLSESQEPLWHCSRLRSVALT